jgi:RNA polymerase sigma-70 factor (ECF subfamily)
VAMQEYQTEKSKPMFQYQANSERYVTNKELGSILEKALQNIPTDYRMVFTLRELNGYTVSETADALGILENNVKVRLNRAKAMLRGQIEKMYVPEDIFEFNLVYCDSMVKRVMTQVNIKTKS